MTTAIENLLCNKRKFISDDEVYSHSARVLSTANQIHTNCNTKKAKSVEIESTVEVDDTMICDNPNSIVNDTTNKSQVMLVSEHCNGLFNTDASPTTLLFRCYCDPYRLNDVIPYDMDIY